MRVLPLPASSLLRGRSGLIAGSLSVLPISLAHLELPSHVVRGASGVFCARSAPVVCWLSLQRLRRSPEYRLTGSAGPGMTIGLFASGYCDAAAACPPIARVSMREVSPSEQQ